MADTYFYLKGQLRHLSNKITHTKITITFTIASKTRSYTNKYKNIKYKLDLLRKGSRRGQPNRINK